MTTLRGELFLWKQNIGCTVTLNQEGLSYESVNSAQIREHFEVKDIAGCTCKKLALSEKKVLLNVVAFQLLKAKRQKRTASFIFSDEVSYQLNLERATRWKEAIYATIYSIRGSSEAGQLYTSSPLFGDQKKLLIFINPKSGTGTAKKIYKKHVKQLLDEAEISHEVILTGWANGAYAAVQKRNLKSLSGIVVISGDGLLYEVYNGLLKRSDWMDALSTPVAILPGGSGNGLARSIGHALNEPYLNNPVLVSALNILNPVVTPMDLVLVHTFKKERLVSFLSIGLGLLSDIDIESESLRALGDIRFTLWSFRRLMALKKYRCKLSFKRADQSTHVRTNSYRSLSHSTSVQNGINVLPAPDHASPLRKCQSMYYDSYDVTSHQDHIPINNAESSAILERQTDVLSQPVPSDWETIEDDFVMIYAVYQAFISKDGCISPHSRLNDGMMYLWVATSQVSKTTMLKFLLSIDNGPTEMEGLMCIPTVGLRIEPLGTHGKLTIDGELIDYGPIHAELLPGKGSIMTRPL